MGCLRFAVFLGFSFLVTGLSAQSTGRGVDWTQPAISLTVLNSQILDWQKDFERLASGPVTQDSLAAILALHFQKGPIVIQGWAALQDAWKNHSSDSEKKSRYLAVSHYFATHLVELGDAFAWEWYRCFAPPLTQRYNFLAADEGLEAVKFSPQEGNLLASITPDERKALFQRCRATVTDFLGRSGYPLTEDSISKMTFGSQGILLSGRYPKDRGQLNKDFTFTGSALFLFGMGL